MNKKVLITGGSGLIGSRLTQHLLQEGYNVHWLSRNPKDNLAAKQHYWNPLENKIDNTALEGAEIVVNLAGAGIADKLWTPARKQLLLTSRVQSIQLLNATFQQMDYCPKKFISASAVGFYGNRPGVCLDESAPKGSGFLSDLTTKWEQATDLFANKNIEITKLRIGIVLSNKGGSLPLFERISALPIVMLPGGNQIVPWIHIDDMTAVILEAIQKDTIKGNVNCVSPNPVSLKSLLKEIAKTKGKRRMVIGAPSFPIKLITGDMSEIVLNSQRVVPKKLIDIGFHWKYPEIGKALNQLLFNC